MEQLLLINPAKRPGKRRKTRRTAAQRAATARMVAANRRRRSPARRRRSPAPVVYAANPAPRRRRRRTSLATVSRRVRRYRRNPSPRAGFAGMFMPAVQGALGATAVNTLLNYLPLPAVMKAGNMQYVARGLLAVMIGAFGGKVMPARMASNMAVGSLTVTFHDALKNVVGPMIPGVTLGYYPGGVTAGAVPGVYAGAAPAALAEYVSGPGVGLSGVNEYVNSGLSF